MTAAREVFSRFSASDIFTITAFHIDRARRLSPRPTDSGTREQGRESGSSRPDSWDVLGGIESARSRGGPDVHPAPARFGRLVVAAADSSRLTGRELPNRPSPRPGRPIRRLVWPVRATRRTGDGRSVRSCGAHRRNCGDRRGLECRACDRLPALTSPRVGGGGVGESSSSDHIARKARLPSRVPMIPAMIANGA